MSGFRSSLAVLGEFEFRKLFLGQAISVVGMMFTVVALPFAVLAAGGSATDIGIVMAAEIVPLTVFLLIGGVWSDRLPRQKVMLAADFARTLLQVSAAALLISGAAQIWQLAALQVGMGISEAFFRPSYTGLLPQVVSPLRLQQANALQGLVQSTAVALGALLAGLLVAAIGPGWAIGLDAATYLVSAWFLWRLRPAAFLGREAAATTDAIEPDAGAAHAVAPGVEPAPNRSGFLRDLVAGWHEFTSHTWLWVMVVGVSAFLFAVQGPIEVLGPIVARDSYDGPRTWGFVSAAIGLGSIIGGLVSLRWRPRRPMLVLSVGMCFAAVPVALMALRAPLPALMGALVVMGAVWGMYDTFWLTCMQNEVAPDMISRVSSYDFLGSLAFFPAGLALAGPLAAAFGVDAVLWGAAAVVLLVAAFQLSWRDVRAPHALRPPAPE